MGFFDFLGGKTSAPGAPASSSATLPGNSIVLSNEVVLSALIGPGDSRLEEILTRAAAGNLTPVIFDRSLFLAMSSVRPEDKVDAARFARLLRFALVVPTERGPEEQVGLTQPSPDEIERWRAVVFGAPSAPDRKRDGSA